MSQYPSRQELKMAVHLARVLSASSERLLQITEELLARYDAGFDKMEQNATNKPHAD